MNSQWTVNHNGRKNNKPKEEYNNLKIQEKTPRTNLTKNIYSPNIIPKLDIPVNNNRFVVIAAQMKNLMITMSIKLRKEICEHIEDPNYLTDENVNEFNEFLRKQNLHYKDKKESDVYQHSMIYNALYAINNKKIYHVRLSRNQESFLGISKIVCFMANRIENNELIAIAAHDINDKLITCNYKIFSMILKKMSSTLQSKTSSNTTIVGIVTTERALMDNNYTA